MQRQQGRLFARFVAAIDVTGKTRRKRKTDVQVLKQRHRQERRELAALIRETRSVQAEAVRVRYQPDIDGLKQERRQGVTALKERQRDDRQREDGLLQAREAERERERAALQLQLDTWKKAQRQTGERQGSVSSPLAQDWQGKDRPARSPLQRPDERHRQPDDDDTPRRPTGRGLSR